MASHFVRWTLAQSRADVQRIPADVVEKARFLSEKRRSRYLAARMLLAELMLRVYGMPQLPGLTTTANGRPCFIDPDLPDFSIAYAGNVIGVLLAEEQSRAGLDMEMVRAHSRQTVEHHLQHLSSGEKAWINAQQDPLEAITQIWTLRQSILKLTGEKNDCGGTLQLHPASGRLRSPVFPDVQAVCDVEPLLIWSCALSPATSRLRLWEIDDLHNWTALRDIEMNKANMGPQTLRLTSMPLEKQLQQRGCSRLAISGNR
ncbi:4'-phosphopantetheinyl transferase family protein [Mixta gaviniae]|uniref:Phosphopantetheinyl transferase n=1 Tax=Mixta gaviniae TaxID=665914 RepID=A0A2L0IB93_9GAMM|nr:phosphopantetheinyl transferase [Mixta gaviniae]AUX91652.1 phosphopantetheinyl transferase [Mixta gaviniae]